jgi:hypothetical protein
MDDVNEDELILYEESKEIKETIWKIWDIVNDKEIIMKLLLNSSLVKELQNAHSQLPNILDDDENNKISKEDKNEIISTKIDEEEGKN